MLIFFSPILLLICSSLASMGGSGGDLEDILWDVSDKQKKFLISVTSSILVLALAFVIFVST